ncbi:hypothetical protein PQX77_022219 [Marasmius sp. AFHP31]|nr:hypothetical protein PQX77_022219 [Marasmius sp. AFHP31]
MLKISDAKEQAQREMPHHIHALLSNANRIPSSEIGPLSHFIQQTEHEAEHLRRTIEQLSERVLVLEHHATLCTPLLSPIRRLPPEILGEILTLAAEQNVFSIPTRSRWDSSRVSSVCSLWRTVALEEPEVWRNVTVEFDVDRKYHPALLKALETHLERSQGYSTLNCELRIDQELRTYFGPALIHSGAILKTIFSPHGYRIGDLHVVIHNNYMWGLLERIVNIFLACLPNFTTQEDISRITSLRLSEMTPSSDYPEDHRDVEWEGFPSSAFPCSRITSLHLNPASYTAVITAFRFFPNVVTVDIALAAPWENDDDLQSSKPVPPLRLSQLESLAVRNISLGERDCFARASRIFQSIDAPKLNDLSIRRNDQMHGSREKRPTSSLTNHLAESVVSFFDRSKPPLHAFHCSGVAFDGSDVQRLLQATPSGLAELTIEDNTFLKNYRSLGKGVLSLLHWNEGTTELSSSRLLPRLRTLTLSPRDDTDWAVLVAMVRSRAVEKSVATTPVALRQCRLKVKVRAKAKQKDVLKIRKEVPKLDIDLVPSLDSYY